jgi:hypothetical protein
MDISGVDIANKQAVGVNGSSIVIMFTQPRMSKLDALVHAAWLVALADTSENYEDFRGILKRVLNT